MQCEGSPGHAADGGCNVRLGIAVPNAIYIGRAAAVIRNTAESNQKPVTADTCGLAGAQLEGLAAVRGQDGLGWVRAERLTRRRAARCQCRRGEQEHDLP